MTLGMRMTRAHSPEVFKERMLSYLKACTRQEYPKVSREIQTQWNINDVTVRQTIGLLRDDGEPIASGPKGYFYARTPDELESTIDNLGERIAVMTRRKSMLIQCQNKMKEDDSGQRQLFTDIKTVYG